MALVFNRDLLFVHVPKAAGTSISRYLLTVLPPPVYYVRPKAFPDLDGGGGVYIEGKKHQTLREARNFVRGYGFRFAKLPLILAVMRNPYDAMVSGYHYHGRTGSPNPESVRQKMASEMTFQQYVEESRQNKSWHNKYRKFFHLGGQPTQLAAMPITAVGTGRPWAAAPAA